ncbi:class I SAM-dependent methyltransferase [Tamlana sp. 2201CG12-4]|uniref:class I SAM-dependent methyltransferase n=1 Tax=Tamlana sp. 2201CG12-4 TaxID=3112582 RepID=UPI002DB77FF6|nr:class I SAM-dependent methyltransferase [Tamlana sp. 2201CG12-4]MEC3905747.1 class I SAM-dependent methyltransferase [Tamlana sp. 2201CG12-4]
MTKKAKQPWPTKKAMDQIYDMKLWGGKTFDFYSGTGSHDPNIITPYLDKVITFLNSHKTPLTVCDLGCGDFNIGRHLVKHTKKYIAVDIVETLIKRNQALYTAKNLEFHCLDIAKDKLPSTDCVILRQVLQHLSNAEILSIVKTLKTYKYIILTEHIPTGSFTPNIDIISGQGIRLKHNSGIDLLESPFNLTIKDKTLLDQYSLEPGKGRIVTIVYQVF